MSIILQSTVSGFSDAFMRELPLLEKTMIAHGLDPSEFVISKDRASPNPFFGKCWEYTVFFGDDKFTVTETTDTRFLEYLARRCIAADEQDLPRFVSVPGAGLVRRFLNWMAQPI